MEMKADGPWKHKNGVTRVISAWNWKDLALVVNTSALLIVFTAYASCPSPYPSPAVLYEAPSREECEPGGWLAPSVSEGEDPWYNMKINLRPARCLVKGKWAIEELDPEHNFRRVFALKFTNDVEDKYQVLPYMLATQDKSLLNRKRRVYIDFGANRFDTSITWMNRNYPLDFTEMHAFEVQKGLFAFPKDHKELVLAEMTQASLMTITGRTPSDIPQWMLNRIQFHNQYVSHKDKPDGTQIDATRFIKEELKLTKDDSVIVKMDIEGAEWAILEQWAADPEMADIVDELFVEIHYQHPTMVQYGWSMFSQTRDDATNLLVKLRDRGFYVHCWP